MSFRMDDSPVKGVGNAPTGARAPDGAPDARHVESLLGSLTLRVPSLKGTSVPLDSMETPIQRGHVVLHSPLSAATASRLLAKADLRGDDAGDIDSIDGSTEPGYDLETEIIPSTPGSPSYPSYLTQAKMGESLGQGAGLGLSQGTDGRGGQQSRGGVPGNGPSFEVRVGSSSTPASSSCIPIARNLSGDSIAAYQGSPTSTSGSKAGFFPDDVSEDLSDRLSTGDRKRWGDNEAGSVSMDSLAVGHGSPTSTAGSSRLALFPDDASDAVSWKGPTAAGEGGSQTLVVMRHGERADDVVEAICQPAPAPSVCARNSSMGRVKGAVVSRPWDPPITELGKQEAFKVGRELRLERSLTAPVILSSPFLRCVETAAQVAAALLVKDAPGDASKEGGVQPQAHTQAQALVKVMIHPGLSAFMNAQYVNPAPPKVEVGGPESESAASTSGASAEQQGQRGGEAQWSWLLSNAELAQLLPAGTFAELPDSLAAQLPPWPEADAAAAGRAVAAMDSICKAFPRDDIICITHGEVVAAHARDLASLDVYSVDYCGYTVSERLLLDGEVERDDIFIRSRKLPEAEGDGALLGQGGKEDGELGWQLVSTSGASGVFWLDQP